MKPQTNNATGGLLANEDVQKLMKVVEGLLNGSKKLVIDSQPYVKVIGGDSDGNEMRATRYIHTFKVEDVK